MRLRRLAVLCLPWGVLAAGPLPPGGAADGSAQAGGAPAAGPQAGQARAGQAQDGAAQAEGAQGGAQAGGAQAGAPVAGGPGGGAQAGGARFQVIDETDPQEISEDTVVFLNGVLVAHFKLDRSHNYSIADIAVPAKGPYDYALCGRITVALPDGQQEQRVVDGGARLPEVSGHVFRALAANDFSIFYLADAQANPPLPPKDARHTDACSLPVS